MHPLVAHDAVTPETFPAQGGDAGGVEAFAVVDQQLAEAAIGIGDNLQQLFGQRRFDPFGDVLDQVAHLQPFAVFPEIPLEGRLALADKVVPVEEKGAEILTGKALEFRATGQARVDQFLFPPGEEEGEGLLDRIHFEDLDKLGAEVGIVEILPAHGGKGGRQVEVMVTEKGEVIVAEVAGEEELFAMRYLLPGKEIHQADMVVGEAGQHLFFGVEELETGAVVGEAETDKTVVDQAGEERRQYFQEFVDGKIGGIIDGRALFRVGGRLLGLIVIL